MGKVDEQQLRQQHEIQEGGSGSPSGHFCQRFNMGLIRIGRAFNFKCLFILMLSVCVFLSAVFWLPVFPSKGYRFDANDLNATVQARFKLPKPVSLLVEYTETLEYDIFGEIGVPYTKISILSMHESVVSNWTDVVFGVLPDPRNVPINTVSLSVLRSSLIELVLQRWNLSLTTSIFGQPSSFQILKFPGGITVIPLQFASIWQLPQILFNFTLYNSVSEIQENFDQFKEQLKLGLQLWSDENVYVQVTNKNGSTVAPPVTVQASVLSDVGSHNLLPQRLKQLAQTIAGSPPTKNLGLDHSVFGKVKEIRLSSFLNRTLRTSQGSPSPSPSPSLSLSPSPSDENEYSAPLVSSYLAPSPSYSLAPSADHHHLKSPPPSAITIHSPRRSPCGGAAISPSPSPTVYSDSSAPSDFAPRSSTPHLPPSPTPQLSSDLSPSPDSRPGQGRSSGKALVSPSFALPPISSSPSSFVLHPNVEMWLIGLLGFVIFHLLCGPR